MANKNWEPYEHKHLLRRGDTLTISKETPYVYGTVVKMLRGERTMQPEVLAVADRLVKQRLELIEKLKVEP